MKKRHYSIPNNQYERYLNILRKKAWNGMSKTDWAYKLYKYGHVRFCKSK